MDKAGVSVEIRLTANLSTSDDSFYQVDKVDVKLNKFAYAVHNSRHSILATLLYPFIKPMVRIQLQNLLERQIKSQFESTDAYFRDLKMRLGVVKGLGPEAWVYAASQSWRAAMRGRRESRQYEVNIGGEELFKGVRGPLGEEVWKVGRRAEGEEGWKNVIFDPPK